LLNQAGHDAIHTSDLLEVHLGAATGALDEADFVELRAEFWCSIRAVTAAPGSSDMGR
jgi:hypothetical protein